MSRTPAPAARKATARNAAASTPKRSLILVATRKGAWFFHSDASRRVWKADGPHFLGHSINQVTLDPRDGRTLLAAAKTGHLGPTISNSRRVKVACFPALIPCVWSSPISMRSC